MLVRVDALFEMLSGVALQLLRDGVGLSVEDFHRDGKGKGKAAIRGRYRNGMWADK